MPADWGVDTYSWTIGGIGKSPIGSLAESNELGETCTNPITFGNASWRWLQWCYQKFTLVNSRWLRMTRNRISKIWKKGVEECPCRPSDAQVSETEKYKCATMNWNNVMHTWIMCNDLIFIALGIAMPIGLDNLNILFCLRVLGNVRVLEELGITILKIYFSWIAWDCCGVFFRLNNP